MMGKNQTKIQTTQKTVPYNTQNCSGTVLFTQVSL